MPEPSDHLLRTFATVPVESRILDVGCGDGMQTEALIQLGFDVFACDPSPENVADVRASAAVHIGEEEAGKRISQARVDALGYPDEFFNWVVAFGALARSDSRESLLEGLSEIRRVLRSGGWLYVTVPAIPEPAETPGARGYAGDSGLKPTFTPRTLNDVMEEAGYALAEGPTIAVEKGGRIVQGIYRRADEGTPG